MGKSRLDQDIEKTLDASEEDVEKDLRALRLRDSAHDVALALQGNGIYAALGWGILDFMLEATAVQFKLISAVGTGALNALALTDGLTRGGREGARKSLRQAWEAIVAASGKSETDETLRGRLHGILPSQDPDPVSVETIWQAAWRAIDFQNINSQKQMEFLIAATHVATGRVRLFGNKHGIITPELLAACTANPFHNRAVEIDGAFYWDASYVANPPLFVFSQSRIRDYVVVATTPSVRGELPQSAVDIQDRLEEITSAAAFEREIRQLWFLSRMVDNRQLDKAKFIVPNLHVIGRSETSRDAMFRHDDAPSDRVQFLFQTGRKIAADWAAKHLSDIGVRSSTDLLDLLT
jgi:NTE family protein